MSYLVPKTAALASTVLSGNLEPTMKSSSDDGTIFLPHTTKSKMMRWVLRHFQLSLDQRKLINVGGADMFRPQLTTLQGTI